MTDNKTILAIRIKELRKASKLTQEELAKYLGLNNKSSIANYESGYSIPSDEIKLKMCKIFDCSMDYLMGNSNQKNEVNTKESLERKFNISLKNKYINKFLELKLSNFEIENLIKLIDSEDDSISNDQYTTLLNNIFSTFEIKYNNEILNKIKLLIEDYFQEKLTILKEEIDIAKRHLKKSEENFIKAHIDKLHPSMTDGDSFSLEEKVTVLLNYLDRHKINNFDMCPVYGRISAGQPNWAEESLEGYLPINCDMMRIRNSEECFFLRVSGESMNKVIKNGGYALIRKQEEVENGEIAVVLVNGFDATLKKFTKKNNMVILEPMSDDPSYEIQIYDKTTPIQIIGKYIGKFEMN